MRAVPHLRATGPAALRSRTFCVCFAILPGSRIFRACHSGNPSPRLPVAPAACRSGNPSLRLPVAPAACRSGSLSFRQPVVPAACRSGNPSLRLPVAPEAGSCPGSSGCPGLFPDRLYGRRCRLFPGFGPLRLPVCCRAKISATAVPVSSCLRRTGADSRGDLPRSFPVVPAMKKKNRSPANRRPMISFSFPEADLTPPRTFAVPLAYSLSGVTLT